jgi:glycosyltransferase involved in cell wall biosynthesis
LWVKGWVEDGEITGLRPQSGARRFGPPERLLNDNSLEGPVHSLLDFSKFMADAQPLVTLVTSSFNQARFLEQTMQSVFNQTYPRIEYIVTDAGSIDGSAEIIQRNAGRLHYWHSRKDQGPADGLRQGFERANGQIFAWLNADDVLAEDAVAKAVAALARHPEAVMVYGNRIVIDGEGRLLYRRPSLPCLAQTPYIGTILPQETCFFRREIYFTSGGLNTAMRFAFDYDLFSKFARRGKLVYSGDIWGFFRKHGSSLTMLQFGTTGQADARVVQDQVWGRRCGPIEWKLAHLLVKAYVLAAPPFVHPPSWPRCLPPMKRIGLFRSYVASLHETSSLKKFLSRFLAKKPS